MLIAGPCAIEGDEVAFGIAEKLTSITSKLSMPLVFKGSYRKANRTRLDSFTGIGDIKALKLEKSQLVYVPPLWLHRSVNIGDSELVTLFTYNSDAGQNYEILKKSGGMRKRVVQKDNNSWTLVENTRFSLSS